MEFPNGCRFSSSWKAATSATTGNDQFRSARSKRAGPGLAEEHFHRSPQMARHIKSFPGKSELLSALGVFNTSKIASRMHTVSDLALCSIHRGLRGCRSSKREIVSRRMGYEYLIDSIRPEWVSDPSSQSRIEACLRGLRRTRTQRENRAESIFFTEALQTFAAARPSAKDRRVAAP
jgi:hypothetical protein